MEHALKVESETTWVMPSDASGTGATARTIAYANDADGRPATVTYPQDYRVRSERDDRGRVTKISRAPKVGGSWTVTAKWTFQGPSRIKNLEFGDLSINASRVVETLTYDVYGRATTLTHARAGGNPSSKIVEYTRGYDAGGRPTFERRDYWSQANALLGGQKDYGDLYAYDHADRLICVFVGSTPAPPLSTIGRFGR